MTAKTVNEKDKAIGERLRKLRLLAGFSQEATGTALGITFQQIQKYESGKNRLAVSRLLDICELYDCEPMDILSVAWDGNSEAPVSGPVAKAVERASALQTRIDHAMNILKGRGVGDA